MSLLTRYARQVISASMGACRECGFHGQGLPAASHHHHKQCNHQHTQAVEKEYAFEMASSTIRFGRGVTQEIGMDLNNLGVKKTLVVTDRTLAQLPPVRRVLDSLTRHKVLFEVYDQVRIEPTDSSFQHAISAARNSGADSFVAVGGGSVMDTAKAANLYTSYPEFDFLDFVNAPVGNGRAVPGPVKPLIAVPTTAGTGSETTGVAIFDYEPLQAKTGIGSRVLKPTLALIDPENTDSLPQAIAAASGFDVLCHALESFTALPFTERTPRPSDPSLRPTYQGANPMSDIWAMEALKLLARHFVIAVKDPEAKEAREKVLLAATFAGVGFGNAGVHLCHGLSYPISGLNKVLKHVQYKHPGYPQDSPLVPHGVSVVVTAPAVFRFTAGTNIERHMQAAEALGATAHRVGADADYAGNLLAERVMMFMDALEIPRGLSRLGFQTSDIPRLVEGALPQQRVLKIAPKQVQSDAIAYILENSMEY